MRPLALGATGEIAAAMGWSIHYTLSVLRHWKMTAAYCNAILRYEVRIDLDGVPTEAVGARAKNLATKHLRRHMAGKSTAKLAKATAPALMAPSRSAPAIEPQKQLRERVRASLFRRNG